jgi:hypothetical protein
LLYVIISDEGELLAYKEAMPCELSTKRDLAMEEKIKSLYANHTSNLVSLLEGMRALLNKWIY